MPINNPPQFPLLFLGSSFFTLPFILLWLSIIRGGGEGQSLHDTQKSITFYVLLSCQKQKPKSTYFQCFWSGGQVQVVYADLPVMNS